MASSILASKISDNAGILLNDIGAVRWTLPERLTWINDGRREMARLKPEIFGGSSYLAHTLTAGSRQTVTAAGAYKIDRVEKNVSSGKAILPAIRSQFDAFNPSWQNDTATDVANWFPDEANPLAFWVHPTAAGKVVALYAFIDPADLSALNQVALPVDIYSPILLNYLLYRAYAKEDEAGAEAKAQAYFTLFTTALAPTP